MRKNYASNGLKTNKAGGRLRDYAKIAPQFWIGETGKALRKAGAEAQIVALYLMTNPHANMLGMYYLPMLYIVHETGLSEKGARKGLARAIEGGFCSYDEASEVVFVHEMARFQIGDRLQATDKRCAGVQNEYDQLPANPFLSAFYERYAGCFHMVRKRENASPIKAPSKPLRSQEQEQEQEQELKTLSGKPDVVARKPEAIAILTYLNDKAGTAYRAVDANVDLILARLKEGATPDEIRAVIDRKVSAWSGGDMAAYLRPATLFNKTKFAQYVGEVGGGMTEDIL